MQSTFNFDISISEPNKGIFLRPFSVKGFENRYMFNILLIASKKALKRKWMKTETPTVEDWIND